VVSGLHRECRHPPQNLSHPCSDIAFSVRLNYPGVARVRPRALAARRSTEMQALNQTDRAQSGEQVRGLPGLRAAREAKLLTQHELAAAAGVDPSTISQLEAGNRNAHLRTIRLLAGALSVSAQELLASATPMRRARRPVAPSEQGAN
jgi:DNA-binding XRE family transcriptional regulator